MPKAIPPVLKMNSSLQLSTSQMHSNLSLKHPRLPSGTHLHSPTSHRYFLRWKLNREAVGAVGRRTRRIRPRAAGTRGCGAVFPSKEEVKRHVAQHHITTTEESVCAECGQVFISTQGLKFHMSKHTGNVYFRCNWSVHSGFSR